MSSNQFVAVARRFNTNFSWMCPALRLIRVRSRSELLFIPILLVIYRYKLLSDFFLHSIRFQSNNIKNLTFFTQFNIIQELQNHYLHALEKNLQVGFLVNGQKVVGQNLQHPWMCDTLPDIWSSAFSKKVAIQNLQRNEVINTHSLVMAL